jgi:hypothetical protein
MPAPSAWDEHVRVCGIPSRHPGSHPGLPRGGCLAQDAICHETGIVRCRGERFQIGLARQPGVERLEAFRGPEQHQERDNRAH